MCNLLLKFFLFTSFALTLTSCATFQFKPSAQPELHYLKWQDRKKQLHAINNWYVQGSLGVTYRNKTEIVTFDWRKVQKSYLVNLYGPLHLGSVQISGDDRQAVLLQSSGKKAQAATPEELMQRQLGWDLPLDNLNYWARALVVPSSASLSLVSEPVPAPTAVQFDVYNHLIEFTQGDWQISYREFRVFNGIDLPTKIYLNSPQLRVKLVIKKWEVLS